MSTNALRTQYEPVKSIDRSRMNFYIIQSDDPGLVRNFFNVTEFRKNGDKIFLTVEIGWTKYSRQYKTYSLENVISIQSN